MNTQSIGPREKRVLRVSKSAVPEVCSTSLTCMLTMLFNVL